MYDVKVVGIGLCVEDAQRPLWKELSQALTRKAHARWLLARTALEDSELVPAKERRILSDNDVLGIHAADLACRDASSDFADDAACVVLNTGKHTVEGERDTYRREFMRADGTFDTLAMSEAVARGEAQINPFSLLRTLDNNVLWWLCRYRNFAAINLQITQRMTPSFFALWEAVELVREGSATQVLVGGTQAIEQASVDRTHETGRFTRAAADEVGGGALFFVLERGDSVRARRGASYADLSIERPRESASGVRLRDSDVGVADGGRAPGLASLLALLDAILRGRALSLAGESHAFAPAIAVRPELAS